VSTVAQPVELDLDADTLLTDGRFTIVSAQDVYKQQLVIMGARIYRVTSVRQEASTTLYLRRGSKRLNISLDPNEDVVLAMPTRTI
jgi:hypothetical protein